VGVVVVTHDGAAHCLLGAARNILGNLPASQAVSTSMSESLAEIAEKVDVAVAQVDAGAGALILVDVHGATPYNAAMKSLGGERSVEVVCGVNLPMLLKISTCDRRHETPGELAQRLCDIGRRSIRVGSELAASGVPSGKGTTAS